MKKRTKKMSKEKKNKVNKLERILVGEKPGKKEFWKDCGKLDKFITKQLNYCESHSGYSN